MTSKFSFEVCGKKCRGSEKNGKTVPLTGEFTGDGHITPYRVETAGTTCTVTIAGKRGKLGLIRAQRRTVSMDQE